MEAISLTNFALNEMCRLCLASGEPLIDLFSFSVRFENILANAVMECAPVQIRSGDEMPNFICQKCHTRLEKTYQFQMQIIESEKTLQRYLEQLHAFDRKQKPQNSIQIPIEDPLIENTNAEITEKCESLELHGVVDLNVNWREKEYENSNSASKISIEMSLKSEMKDEQDNSINSPDCADDSVETFSKDVGESIVNMGDSKLMEDMNEESANLNSPCKSIEEVILKTEIEDESMEDGSLILTDSIDDTVNNFSNGVSETAKFASTCDSIVETSLKSEIKDVPTDNGSLILTEFTDDTVSDFSNRVGEISCEDAQVGLGLISENSANFLSYDVQHFKKFKERIKNTSMDGETHKNKKRYIKSRFLESTSSELNRCDICKKCFSTKINLNAHKLIHTGEKPFQCDTFEQYFTQSNSLNNHQPIRTGEKSYQCDICYKCFATKSNLNSHKLTHTGEKPYQCDICKKCFTQQGHLNTHKQIHTGEKPYQCDICEQYFTQSKSLNIHRLIHTGEKPHQCDICKKCFTRSDSLNRHKLIHSGEKPYQCDICEKYFTHSRTLDAHKPIHTGEKLFRCDICKKCFTHSSSLYTHKRIHTGEKPYQCDICKKCFTQQGHLNTHKLIHTNGTQSARNLSFAASH